MNLFLNILFYLLVAIQFMAMFYFVLPFILYLLKIFGIKRTYKNKSGIERHFSFAAIITAHKETRFLPPFIDSLQKQLYTNFSAYIIADDCDEDELEKISKLQDNRIKILRPEPALHSKTASIRYAVEHFDSQHDVLVIFDADNLLHPSYFENINNYFNKGFSAVQSHMLSKNIDTPIAKIDSIGHIYNNFTERESKMNLGLHSAILGLGIAVKIEIYNKLIYNTKLGGFDKILQTHLAMHTPQIGFAKDAIVYDEKVDSGEALEVQRTRWIYTYFKYLKLGASLLWHGLTKMKIGTLLLALSMIRPPLFLLVFSAFLFLLIDLVIAPNLAILWIGSLILFATTYIAIIASESKQPGMLSALLHIPKMIVSQFKALFKIQSAKTNFLQTHHDNVIYIDDILSRKI